MTNKQILPILLCISAMAFFPLPGWCEPGRAEIPDPLAKADGSRVRTIEEWHAIQRPALLELFRSQVFGRAPIDRPQAMGFSTEVTEGAMGGKAVRIKVTITFQAPHGEGRIRMVVFRPADATGPVPVFLLICHRKPENIDPERTTISEFWPAEVLVSRGYAAAAFHVDEIDPDVDDGFQNGMHGLFDHGPRRNDAWGTLAAWAWGASRCIDYLSVDASIDATKIAVVGHSRGGKAALWCGAQDERVALTVSNESGRGGASFNRGRSSNSEPLARLNKEFPHWFCRNYQQFSGNEETMPFDQHQLLALIAPRLLYVSSAREDAWSHPENEFRSCVEVQPVYDLFRLPGLGTTNFPPVGKPLHDGTIGYHLRKGKHDMTAEDWNFFMDFADRKWKQGTQLSTGH